MAVVVMILCIAAFKMPYPFTIEADGIIVNNNLPGRENYAICMLVPYRYKEFLQGETSVRRVIFNVFKDSDLAIYRELLAQGE